MSQFDHWIERLARRVRWGEFLHRAANWLAVYLMVTGGVVLAAKLLVPRETWPGPLGGEYAAAVGWLLVICGLGAAVPLLISWRRSAQSRLSRTDLVAWLDRRLGAGGLLMTLSETPDVTDVTETSDASGLWSAKLPGHEAAWRMSMPLVRPTRFTRYLAVPLLFAMIACAVPWRTAYSSSTLRDTVGQRETQQLVQLLEELKQAGVLEEKEQEKLDEEIRKLAEDTRRSPLTHEKWETVDSLREQMQMRLDSRSRSLDKALAAVESLESAEFDAKGELTNLDQQYSEQLLEDIRDALKNKSLDELPHSLQELARRYQRQQSGRGKGQQGKGPKGEAGKVNKSGGKKSESGQGNKSGGKKPGTGKGKKGGGKKGETGEGQQGEGKQGKRSSSGASRFGLPSDPAERKQALQDLKEFLEQESRQLEQLRQQAQRNPGGT